MATNLALDDALIEEAMKIAGTKSKKDTVNLALEEFIKSRKRIELAKLFGKVEMDDSYNVKKARQKR